MSWSFNMRVLGFSVLLAAVGCGGNPEVGDNDGTSGSGGASTAGKSSTTAGTGAGGSLNVGGTEPGDGGEPPTETYVCGNQELEPGEFCDDGNTDDDDGCSGDCSEVDLDYDCSVVGEPCVKVVICGNGVLEGDEACDDLNLSDDDGCSADCSTIEDGWMCVRPGKECVRVSVCGNGVRERGEACDDGVTPPESGDGCDELCQNIEPTYYCPFPGQLCVQQVCGDAVRTPGETCDDGNQTSGDGCNATCTLVEPGWHCNAMGCKTSCGDGLVRGTEECDDGNASGGDGCSGGCNTEPLWSCNDATPNVCGPALTPQEACGNGQLDPIFAQSNGKWQIASWEVCDPPNQDGCNASCTAIIPEMVTPPVCGNQVLEGREECDKPAADPGCSSTCTEEPGYRCPAVGACTRRCGDGTVDFALGEGCDPPNVNQGCSLNCAVLDGWFCSGLTNSVCVKPVCGNSVVEAGEQCDDGTAAGAQDGCFGCVINTDYVCPAGGQACQPRCGDGKKITGEQCDDGNKVSDDGCNAGCKIEPGFACPTQNVPCEPAVCGNGGDPDSGEGCDDGNTISGDGCSATCQKEPIVTVGPNPTVNVFCGDGLVIGGEACDDGNTDSGDGCDDECDIENGWTCEDETRLPGTLSMRVTYRDFKKRTSSGGHSDFQLNVAQAANVPGPVCLRNSTECTTAPGVVCPAGSCGHLDAQGKPVFHQNDGVGVVTNENTFSLWYRDTNPTNIAGPNGAIQISPLVSSLTLTQTGGAASDVYVYDNAAFYPLTGLGFGNDGNTQNYHFTTELRYFFQYQGGETLSFRGDDDVWVFINGRHAVDIGGVHGAQYGRVVLGDDGGTGATDSNCSQHRGTSAAGACTLQAAEIASDDDLRFGLVKGGVYEIVLFHAERHTVDSNFRLTLAGFVAPRSFCEPECGDGVVVGDEFCDDGGANSNTVAGACKTDCTARNFCGDAVRQQPGEACDNGVNGDLYKTPTSPATACAPGCKVPASCGDGTVQAGFGEDCDNGASNSNSSYGPNSCKTNCTLGAYCGDEIVNGSELCDTGPDNGRGYGPSSCTSTCTPGPRCGDGVLTKGWEACDKGAQNGTPGVHCTTECTIPPYCGDGIKQNNEECDFGPFASTEYGGCTSTCVFGPKCGDGGPGNTPDPEEECDYGSANNTGEYDGCTLLCGLGPRCGDGVRQADEGEACDNGFNADDYDDPKTAAVECGMNCTAPPTCGDGVLQTAHELCDDGACDDSSGQDPTCNRSKDGVASYGGCNTECNFGPYCGDGVPQEGEDGAGNDITEECDDGVENVPYSAEMGGCGYDCRYAPYCGDGERNGPEQCDLGMGENTGEYGTCNEDCTFAPRCGDRVKNGGEQCDDGPAGSLRCTATCRRRDVVQ